MSQLSFDKYVEFIATLTKHTSAEKIDKLYAFVSGFKDSVCNWYWQGIARKRRAAFYLLVLVFLLVITATIIQTIVVNYYRNSESDKFFYSQLAFGLFAVSVVLFLVDKVFGWTSGWVRYIKTVLNIEISYADFLSQWLINIDKNRGNADLCYENAIILTRDFIQIMKQQQKKETDEWALQFGDSLNQLSALIKSNQNTRDQNAVPQSNNQQHASAVTEPGALNVKIKDFSAASSFKIKIENKAKIVAEDTLHHSDWAIIDLTPGIYSVGIIINDVVMKSQAIQIESGKIAEFNY